MLCLDGNTSKYAVPIRLLVEAIINTIVTVIEHHRRVAEEGVSWWWNMMRKNPKQILNKRKSFYSQMQRRQCIRLKMQHKQIAPTTRKQILFVSRLWAHQMVVVFSLAFVVSRTARPSCLVWDKLRKRIHWKTIQNSVKQIEQFSVNL